MGKVLFVIASIGAGWYAYERWFAVSPAYQAYQRYAEARARQDWPALEALSAGAAADELAARRGAAKTRQLDLYGQHLTLGAPSVAEIAGDVSWIEYQRESEERSGDGAVSLVAVQTVCRIPPGVASAICKWPVSVRQRVELAQAGGAWRVEGFSEEPLTP
jgi:hypothetical protein